MSDRNQIKKLLCSKAQAAKMLDCDRGQIRLMLNQGYLRAITLPYQKHEKVVVSSIEEYLNKEAPSADGANS